ncbi:MAG TPA: CocE/NonD family hydrolase [Gemmatimonadales bacterium]|nr:CocE/NonD family hydrolase [Gemmatimonadales bacterium]
MKPSLILILAAASMATSHDGHRQAPVYERRELRIPMRDGTELFAVALLPRDTAPLPILLIRTPYSAADAFETAELPAAYRELAQDGYIFVAEDIRGRFGSGGQFLMMRPGTGESDDAYDTIDWLVKNLPHNSGKVGVLGISYPGWLAALAGVHPHPALKAISPQAPMGDVWRGDDFFHNGAFRETQGLEFAAFMEMNPGKFFFLPIPDYDHYDFYLKYRTLDSVANATGVTELPTWIGLQAHPTWDAYWQERSLLHEMTRPEVPTLFVGGWWDQEDMYGPEASYQSLESRDTNGWNHVVLGPWFHGGWAQPGGDSIGPIPLGGPTADFFRAQIQRPWFAYYLHGIGDGHFPEARAFETGENTWHTFDAWPPKTAAARSIYLHENGALSFEKPRASSTPFDSYVSDPAHPIPYIPRPDNGEGWRNWLERDQRFVDGRPDVRTWVSPPLAEDFTIAGNVVAHLFASTTGTDADWVVKLIDVYPDSVAETPSLGGYELMVSADIMRGRYWRGFTKATPVPANRVIEYTIDLHQQLYRFRAGHRLMVQVQSTWYPLYDRNPQVFVPNIFHARASDFRAQQHRVWHTARYPSHISVQLAPP